VALFLGRFPGRIDSKGRISIPAAFREELADQDYRGIVAYPSLKNKAIEAVGFDRIEELSRLRDSYDPVSDEYDAFSSIFGDAHRVPFDPEGRVILPEFLLGYAGITEECVFLGNIHSFEIWHPDAVASVQESRRALVRERRLPLRSAAKAPEPQ
jgi:MraZ protein